MTRMELAGLKEGNVLQYRGFDIFLTVKETVPLRGILIEVEGTEEEVFVDAEEAINELELYV